MSKFQQHIIAQIEQSRRTKNLRSLNANIGLIDFCSTDYLGFARSQVLKQWIQEEVSKHSNYSLGSTGSRLISGNHTFCEYLEEEIAQFHQAEAGLIFNSGYNANLGLFASLAKKGDTIILDECAHASMVDGARLSLANRFTFKHNDLNSLEQKLKHAKGNIWIGVESIYSMDGDEAPLKDIQDLADRYHAALIVDEAHATGIFGLQGRGKVNDHCLEDRIFARVITFSKAIGMHGAIVLGSASLRLYLINFARAFIYTTAAPWYNQLCVKMAYKFLQAYNHQEFIQKKINLFKKCFSNVTYPWTLNNSTIQHVEMKGNEQALHLAKQLQGAGFDIRAILHPTVPKGKERLRICLHSFNTDQEIIQLSNVLKAYL